MTTAVHSTIPGKSSNGRIKEGSIFNEKFSYWPGANLECGFLVKNVEKVNGSKYSNGN